MHFYTGVLSLSLSQVGDSRQVLHALRSLLEELRAELREEAQRCCQLQQMLANERASWEIQRAEMRSRIAQVLTRPNMMTCIRTKNSITTHTHTHTWI